MSDLPNPDIVVDVDLGNPGQFFACCGLLELAGRLWPGSEGWFAGERRRGTFQIATAGSPNDTLAEIVGLLTEDMPLATLAADHARYAPDRQPVVLRDPVALRLDWWLDSYRGGDKSELKVWAGQQTPLRNLQNLQTAWREMMAADRSNAVKRNILSMKWPMTGRFGFDPSAAPTAIDVGFSTDEQGIPVRTSPATEMLAAIGLQRCRPVRDDKSRGRWFVYRAWADPLDVSVAPAAVADIGQAIATNAFPVTMRNAQYGNFGWAKRWEQTR
jgi:CRISPR-associated protein Csx14